MDLSNVVKKWPRLRDLLVLPEESPPAIPDPDCTWRPRSHYKTPRPEPTEAEYELAKSMVAEWHRKHESRAGLDIQFFNFARALHDELEPGAHISPQKIIDDAVGL
jgi:hypothetical protein